MSAIAITRPVSRRAGMASSMAVSPMAIILSGSGEIRAGLFAFDEPVVIHPRIQALRLAQQLPCQDTA
jgi:hypothetical protein